ncbi:DUF3261 domain-containing protein [Arenimonas sp.]|uniref:DUF3261 domain-containing protein n=1 Tax=Arenimonas sp. TaxID=1872635 RepID=UPI0039E586C0
MILRALLIVAIACLAACAGRTSRTPSQELELRLPPASLGRGLVLQQRLTFVVAGETRQMDALLEANADGVALAVQAAGQSALVLHWDGRKLEQQRAPWLPPQVRGERVLSDLQLSYWPAQAIRASLPAGWTLDEAAGVRLLRRDGMDVVTVRFVSPDRIEIESHLDGVHLSIDSSPLAEEAQ